LRVAPGHHLGQVTISRAPELSGGGYTFRAGPCSTLVPWRNLAIA
jgi:hypothetical protein